jgi:hypothetical protein
MAHRDIYKVLEQRFANESDLTISMMKRAISDLHITDPAALDVMYESVMFYTGDWPEHEGWGSSDTSALIRSVKATLIGNGFIQEAA